MELIAINSFFVQTCKYHLYYHRRTSSTSKSCFCSLLSIFALSSFFHQFAFVTVRTDVRITKRVARYEFHILLSASEPRREKQRLEAIEF